MISSAEMRHAAPAVQVALVYGLRVQATVTCSRCPWSATMRADDAEEIEAFLPRQLQAHVDEQHRDRE